MRLPGGIRVKLAAALLLIVGGALVGAYLMVVPSLERRLVAAKVSQLDVVVQQTAAQLARSDALSDPVALETIARGLGSTVSARVVVFQALGPPVALTPIADSVGIAPSVIARDPVALAAVRQGTAHGRVTRGGVEYAESASAIVTTDLVLLFSSSLSDPLATVHLVERRLVYATAVALVIALGLGSVVAAIHARRIRRLERAANRIAAGRFDEPVVDGGDDELGQLAAAFERMRVQLAQLDSARKEFVANASHELRTPLFSLAGFLELMDDEDLDEETRAGFLATTRQQVDRLTTLASDLLDLSRIDAGRFRVEQEEVSLPDVAHVLAEELGPIADGSGHVLTVDAEDAWATGDEERVVQVGRALARNAIVHTPPGTHVLLRAYAHDGTARLEVTDDGPGIPSEYRDRVFDRFFRIEGGKASGSGLGLAIARELAEQMGGSVRLESEPGRTSFVLELPVASPAPVAAVFT